jgi:hypothetical protein
LAIAGNVKVTRLGNCRHSIQKHISVGCANKCACKVSFCSNWTSLETGTKWQNTLRSATKTRRYESVLLPYFAQLAKVFSQGKYYVGGPRKVQICRNCLLTNTLIIRFCLFIVVINCCLSRSINGTCAPIFLFTVTVSTRECLACFFTLQNKYPTMYRNYPIGRNSNLKYPIGLI